MCCLRPASGLEEKIEFVFSCQSRNLSTGTSRACAPSPSRLDGKTWQARAEEILHVHRYALRSDAVTFLRHLKIPLTTATPHPLGHHLPSHHHPPPLAIPFLL